MALLVALAGHLAQPSKDPDFFLDTVPRWSWPGEATSNVSFYVARSRGLRFMQTDARGEGFVKDVFRLMATGCATEASPATIVDIGANTGYYSMLAAVFGCPVIAFEPQPGCRSSFEAARARNTLGESRVRYIPKPVSSRAALIEVPSRGCAVTNQAKTEVASSSNAGGEGKGGGRGRAGRRRRGGGRGARNARKHDVGTTTVPTVSMEEALRGSSARVRLVKIDTEGAEVLVLRSLLPVLAQLDNLVVETSAGWWLRRYNVTRDEGAELYASLLEKHGFALARVSTHTHTHTHTHMRMRMHMHVRRHRHMHMQVSTARLIETGDQMRRSVATRVVLAAAEPTTCGSSRPRARARPPSGLQSRATAAWTLQGCPEVPPSTLTPPPRDPPGEPTSRPSPATATGGRWTCGSPGTLRSCGGPAL